MREMDHLALLGEDTFALLLPGATLPDAAAIGERVRDHVLRCRLPKSVGAAGGFTVSVGCVEAHEDDDLQQVMQRAKQALTQAVQQGRNRTWVHDGEQVCSVDHLRLMPG